MKDDITIDDADVVSLAERCASEWRCSPEQAIYRALPEIKERLDAGAAPTV